MAQGSDPTLGCCIELLRPTSQRVQFRQLMVRLAIKTPAACLTDLVGKDEAVLKNPRLFEVRPDVGVIGGLVDLRGSLAQSDQGILDLHVGTRTVHHRRMLEKLGKKQWVLAHSLDWLWPC